MEHTPTSSHGFWHKFASCLVALCLGASFFLSLPAWAEKPVPATPTQAAISMLPHLEWLLDSSGKLKVDDLAKPETQRQFRPLNLKKLPQDTGTVWLRFTVAARPPEVRPATLLLDMGEGVPSTPTLFVPKHNVLTNATEWQEFTPNQRSIFLMPEAKGEPLTAYIRMEGLPGMWFAPVLRTPHNAATALDRLARPGVIVALGVVMLLCLLRGLTERGEWRVWTSLYTGAALLHAVWGIPATSQGHVPMGHIAAVVAPGVALILLPHVARHLMQTRRLSRAIDIQYLLLTLPGVAVALVPLVPGYSWTARFLELWPAATLLLVPTTMGAWLCGLPGARRFLLGCLLPPLGVAAALLGMDGSFGLPPSLLATAPLWGLALGALIMAGTAAPQEHDEVREEKSAPRELSHEDLLEGDPDLRIVTSEEVARENQEQSEHSVAQVDSHAMEELLRAPVEQLLRDVVALENCSLPPAARQLVASIADTARGITGTITAPVSAGGSGAGRGASITVFDLQGLLRQAHDAVSFVADSKNIALSWFMPPHLPQYYRGDAAQLLDVLRLLLESSVRATSRGAVQLAVRRVPESVDPGHLLFTVTDTGTGVPPQERSSLALARAWELAGAHHGFLGMESGPHGASISFTLRCEASAPESQYKSDLGMEQEQPRIIIVTDNPGDRQLWTFFLEELSLKVVEARSGEEAAALYQENAAALLIVDADMTQPSLALGVERVRAWEKEQGLPPALLMALSSSDAQWDALEHMGFTHVLPKPITRTGLRATVCELLPSATGNDADLANLSNAVFGVSLGMRDAPQAAADAMPLFMGQQSTAPVQEDEIIDTGLPLPDLSMPLAEPPLTLQGGRTEHVQNVAAPLSMPSPQVEEPPLSFEPLEVDPSAQALSAPQAEAAMPHLYAPLTENADPERAVVAETAEETAASAETGETAEIGESRDVGEKASPAQEEEVSAALEALELSPPAYDAQEKMVEQAHAPAAPEHASAHRVLRSDEIPDLFPPDMELLPPQGHEKELSLEAPVRRGHSEDRTNAAYLTSLLLDREPEHGKSPARDEEIQSVLPASLVSTASAISTQGASAPNPPRIGAAYAASHASSSTEDLGRGGEWVGEPVPLAKAQSGEEAHVEAPALAAPPLRTPAPLPSQAVEWVGEPVPIVKSPTEHVAAPAPVIEEEASPVETSPVEEATQHAPEAAQPLLSGMADEVLSPPRHAEKQHAPKSQQEEPFVPLSFGPEPSAETEKIHRSPRPSLLPPTSSLTDFIIGAPTEAASPAADRAPVATQAPAAPVPASVPTPASTIAPEQKKAVTTVPDSVGAKSGAVAASTSRTFAENTAGRQPFSGSVGEPVPVSKVTQNSAELPLEKLVQDLDTGSAQARHSFEQADAQGVAQAAAFIAGRAESFGLRTLGRMARTVEAAAKAEDLDALRDLLPELESNVERNRIAMRR